MSTTNISEDEKQKPFEERYCSASLTAEIHVHLTFISVLNVFLSATSFLGNSLILVALRKESSLHPPSKLLLRSLAATDLCVGLISEPLYVTYLMSVVNEQWSICRFVEVARLTTDPILCGVSLLTLTAISVDRLLALLLGLRYKQVVTLKRTYVIVIAFWVVPTLFSTMHFLNFLVTFWYIVIALLLCPAISNFSYTKVCITLRLRQNQMQDLQQPNQANQLNIARYRKAVSSALWLQLTLIACYLPSGIVVALVNKMGLSTPIYLVLLYVHTVLFLNSSLNPILYCWKIDEVRQAVKVTIRQALCCSSS